MACLKNGFRELIRERGIFYELNEISCTELAWDSCRRFLLPVNNLSPKCYRINTVGEYSPKLYSVYSVCKLHNEDICLSISWYFQFPKEFCRMLRAEKSLCHIIWNRSRTWSLWTNLSSNSITAGQQSSRILQINLFLFMCKRNLGQSLLLWIRNILGI